MYQIASQFIIAMMLLTNPNDEFVAATTITASAHPLVSPFMLLVYPHKDIGPYVSAIKLLAVNLEILDPKEIKHMFTYRDVYFADLAMLQSRFQEFQDVPKAWESKRFPCRDDINNMLQFNRFYKHYIEVLIPLYPENYWLGKQILDEIEELFYIWDLVRDAECDYYYVTVRRYALKKLLKTVGPDSFYTGQLPPCVPIWRFRKIE